MEQAADDETRKRAAEWYHGDDTNLPQEDAFSKRRRWQDDEEEENNNDANNDDDDEDANNNETRPNSLDNLRRTSSSMANSVAEMIAVPLDLIFHVPPARYGATTTAFTSNGGGSNNNNNTNNNNNHDVVLTPNSKPLLSRAEAHCFVSITLLAHELDSLVAFSAQAILEQRRTYASMRQTLLRHANDESNSSKNPQLLALLPLLYVLGERLPRQRLEQIQLELDTVVAQLQMASLTLRQMSEQNWTLAESLLEAHDAALAVNAAAASGMSSSTSIGEQLALQKQKLSDIQEEVCRRIDKIVSLQGNQRQQQQQQQQQHQNPQRDNDDADAMDVDVAGGCDDQNDDNEDFVRIADYCEQVMNRSNCSTHPSLSCSQSQSQSQGLSGMAQESLFLQQASSSQHDLEEQTRQRLHFELSQPSEQDRDEPSWRPTPATHQTQFSLSNQQQQQEEEDRQESPVHGRSAQSVRAMDGEEGGGNSQTQSPFRTHAVADILTTLASASSHSRQHQHHPEQQQSGS